MRATGVAFASVLTAELLAACSRIRVAAEEFMDDRDLAGLGWDEETVTNVAIHRGLPEVRVVQFNRQQEGRGIGADYLWWWLDRASSECFGMLVQAKRLHLDDAHRWIVDISHRDGGQLNDLLNTARQFQVPAMYAVYTGGRVFRRHTACVHDGTPTTCVNCRRVAVSMISAYQLSTSWQVPRTTGLGVLHSSISLEDLVDPSVRSPDLNHMELSRELPTRLDFFVQGMSEELRSYLGEVQDGPREIAKQIFEAVVRQRMGSFSAGLAESVMVASEALFREVPKDQGHYPGPYFEHFLRGLRTGPPSYVLDVLEGREVPSEIAAEIAGIILIAS